MSFDGDDCWDWSLEFYVKLFNNLLFIGILRLYMNQLSYVIKLFGFLVFGGFVEMD
jgi:hypothetical protein